MSSYSCSAVRIGRGPRKLRGCVVQNIANTAKNISARTNTRRPPKSRASLNLSPLDLFYKQTIISRILGLVDSGFSNVTTKGISKYFIQNPVARVRVENPVGSRRVRGVDLARCPLSPAPDFQCI